MNALVIAPTPYFSDRGCHIRIIEEITALVDAGHTPVVYTYHLGRDEGPVQIYRTVRVPWYTKTAAGPSLHKLYVDLLLLWKILRTAKKHNFDIIHAHLHEGAWIGWFIKHWLRIPLILDAQGSLVGELRSHAFFKVPGLRTVFTFIEGWIVRRADHIFTSSQAAYQFIGEYFPEVKPKLSMLGDAVSVPSFSTVSDDAVTKIASELDIDQTKPVVMYTGGLSKIKGIDLLLDAIPKVLESAPDTQFVIIGYPDIDRCKAIVKNLNVHNAVRFPGRVNYFDLPTYLRLADIAIDPKPSGAGEASGKLLNYMAAGLPVVAFDSVNARDMLADCGSLVSDEHSPALANSIVELLNDTAKAEMLGKKALQRIATEYSWQERIKHASTIYEQLTK